MNQYYLMVERESPCDRKSFLITFRNVCIDLGREDDDDLKSSQSTPVYKTTYKYFLWISPYQKSVYVPEHRIFYENFISFYLIKCTTEFLISLNSKNSKDS